MKTRKRMSRKSPEQGPERVPLPRPSSHAPTRVHGRERRSVHDVEVEPADVAVADEAIEAVDDEADLVGLTPDMTLRCCGKFGASRVSDDC